MKYAHGIVSEYLAEDLSKKLLQYLNLPDDSEQKKRKLSSPKDTTEEKRPKKEAQEESPRNGALDLTKPEKVYYIFCFKNYCFDKILTNNNLSFLICSTFFIKNVNNYVSIITAN